MNNYINSYLYFNSEKEMLSSIKAFLRKKNIRNTDSVVSLYYLYKKTQEFVDRINDVANNNKNLAMLINSFDINMTNLEVKDIRVNLQGNLDDTAKTLFVFGSKNSINTEFNNLCKDSDSNILYWEKITPTLDDNVLLKFYDEFLELFRFRENFILSLLGKDCLSDINNTYAFTAKEDVFKATIDFDQRCHYSHYVEFDIPEELLDHIDKDMNLRYYIAYKEISIMKKIPVKIDSLDNVFKNILNDNKKGSLVKQRKIIL